MFKISRFFLDEFGTKSAFYQDFEINFLDNEKRAKDAVIYGISGTGKTTFLSAFFTLFSPLKRHFISQKRDKNVKITDYYSKNPTVVLAEIPIDDNNLGFDSNYLVVGQIIREDGEDTVQRMMFIYKHPDGIRHTPHRYYQSEDYCKSWSDWESWIKRQSNEERKSKNFRMTRQPKEFSHYLEEEDIDTFLIQKQVALNLQEQGDLAGMSFETEEEFLLFFFDFTLDESKIENSRKHIGIWVEKIVDLPEYRETLSLYEKVFPSSKELLEHAIAYSLESSKISSARHRMNLLYYETLRSKEVLSNMLTSLNAKLEIENERDDKLSIDIEKEQEKKVYLQWNIFDLEYQNSLSKFNKLSQEYKDKFRDYELIKCAGSLDKYLLAQRRYLEIKEQIEQQNRDIIPLVQNQKECASALFDAIDKKNNKYQELEKKTNQSIIDAKENIKRLEKTNRELDKKVNKLNSENSTIQDKIESYQKKLETFKKEKLIYENESKEEAYIRIEKEFREIEGKIKEYKERIKKLESTKNSYQEQLFNYNSKKEKYKTSLKTLSDNFLKAKEKKKELENSEILFDIGLEEVDLYNKDYVQVIEGIIDGKRKDLNKSKEQLQKLEDNISYIDEHGTGKPDANTEYAIKLLKQHGVRNAIYYPTYISNITSTNVTKARELVSSNVGRFMGIAVDSKEALEKVKLIKSDGLDKPVSVSLMTDNIEHSNTDIVSLMPTHDYAYNKESAHAKKIELESETETLNESIFSMEKYLKELNSYRDELNSFYVNFSEEKVRLWENEKKEIDKSLKELIEQEKRLLDKNETLLEELKNAKNNLEDIDISDIKVARSSLKSFIDDYRDLDKKRERQVEIKEEIKKVLEKIVDNDRAINELEENKLNDEEDNSRYRTIILEVDSSKKRALKLITLDSKINYRDKYNRRVEKFDIEGLLDDLEEYSNQVKAYMNKNDSFQLEKSLIEHKSKMDAYKNSFDDKLKQANDTLKKIYTQEDIKPFIEMEYEEAEQTIRKEKEELEKLLNNAKSQKEKFENRFKDYIKENHQFALNEENFNKVFNNRIDLILSRKRLEITITTIANLSETEEKLKTTIKELEKDIEVKQKPYDSFEQILDSWQEKYKPTEVVDFFDLEYSDSKDITSKITDTLNDISTIEDEIKELRANVEKSFKKIINKFTTVLQEKNIVKKSEKKVIEDIKGLTIEDIIENPTHIYRAIEERIIAMQSNIERLKESESTAVDYLGRIADASINALKDISNTKLPKNAGAFANRSIITVNISSLKSMTDATKREILSAYLGTLTQKQSVIPNWKQLCSGIIRALLQGRTLNLKLLLVDEYNFSGKMVKPSEHNLSDGQKLIFQVMMYIALSRIRYRSHTTSTGRNFQGFMVIDNPFGKNTNKETIVPKLELGHAMGIQFIYTMEQENNEMFNLFENVYILSRNTKVGDKQMVKVAHLGMRKDDELGR